MAACAGCGEELGGRSVCAACGRLNAASPAATSEPVAPRSAPPAVPPLGVAGSWSTAAAPTPRPRQSNVLQTVVLLVVLVLVVGAGVVLFQRNGDDGDEDAAKPTTTSSAPAGSATTTTASAGGAERVRKPVDGGNGLSWTMTGDGVPVPGELSLSDGSTVPITYYGNWDPGSESPSGEWVWVGDIGDGPWDSEAGLRGMAAQLGAEDTTPAPTVIAGQPGFRVGLEGPLSGLRGRVWIAAFTVGDRVVVAGYGRPGDITDLPRERFEELLASFQVD